MRSKFKAKKRNKAAYRLNELAANGGTVEQFMAASAEYNKLRKAPAKKAEPKRKAKPAPTEMDLAVIKAKREEKAYKEACKAAYIARREKEFNERMNAKQMALMLEED